MATSILDGEYYNLSRLDLRILVALLKGTMGAYEIARQCELDRGRDARISNSPLYHSLKSLEMYGFVNVVDVAVTRRQKRAYKINAHGRLVLEGELKFLEKLVKLARER